MAENLRPSISTKMLPFLVFWLHVKKTYKKAYFFVVVRRHRIQPPSQAGIGFGLGSGSPVWFWPKLGRRGIELRRHQSPTAGGVPGQRAHGGGCLFVPFSFGAGAFRSTYRGCGVPREFSAPCGSYLQQGEGRGTWRAVIDATKIIGDYRRLSCSVEKLFF